MASTDVKLLDGTPMPVVGTCWPPLCPTFALQRLVQQGQALGPVARSRRKGWCACTPIGRHPAGTRVATVLFRGRERRAMGVVRVPRRGTLCPWPAVARREPCCSYS